MFFEGHKRHKGCGTAYGEKRYGALKWVGAGVGGGGGEGEFSTGIGAPDPEPVLY